MEVCNLISRSIHGNGRSEKVSGKNLNCCLFPYSKSQPVQVRKFAHAQLSCEGPSALGHGSKRFPIACSYWKEDTGEDAKRGRKKKAIILKF